MKPLARYDFPVNIRFHTHEVNKEVQPFYEGIIEVTLNFHIAIVFVPEIVGVKLMSLVLLMIGLNGRRRQEKLVSICMI